MDNRVVTVTPSNAPQFVVNAAGDQVPAEYVVNADGTVSPIPVTGRKSAAYRSRFDENNRERSFIFVRRMNSAACALWLDQVLAIFSYLQAAVLLSLLFVLFGLIDLDTIDALVAAVLGETSSFVLPDELNLLGVVITAVATPITHMLPAYLHSVRNNFSIMCTMKPGSRLGLTLPAATIIALGLTYAWVFVYLVCGWLAPNSFFADVDLFSGTFSGMNLSTAILSAVVVSVITPIAEEFLFRGALLKSFSKYGIPFAVAASSILFGLMHGNLLQAPFAAMGGAVMAYVAIRSGSILPSIFIHFSINAFSSVCDLLVLSFPAQTGMIYYGFFGFAGILVLATIIILCTCSKKIIWKPINAVSSNTLLPVVQTRVRFKFLRMVLSFGMLTLIVLLVLVILVQSGAFNGLL